MNRGRGRGRRRGRGRGRQQGNHNGRLLPTINTTITADFADSTQQNRPTQKGITIADMLTGQNTVYAYRLSSLSVSLQAPTIIKDGNGVAPVQIRAQVYGYMRQDDSLQRLPLCRWVNIPDDRPLNLTFPLSTLRNKIYVGGFVPVTVINSDLMFGVQYEWSSASEVTSPTLKWNFKTTARWTISRDLTMTHISATGERRIIGLDPAPTPTHSGHATPSEPPELDSDINDLDALVIC